VVVGVTDEDKDTVDPWVEKNKPEYPIWIEDSGASAAAFKVTGIPHAFLIDADGKVVWDGHPAGLKDSRIEAVLANAVAPFARLTDQLAPVQELLDQQLRGKAIAQLLLLEQSGKLDERAAKIAVIQRQRLERQAAAMFDEVKRLRDKHKLLDPIVLLQQITVLYDGGPPATEAQKLLKEIGNKDAATKREVEAALPLARARTFEGQKKYDEAYVQYKAVLIYSHTEAETKARLALNELERKGLRGFKADCPDCLKGGKACKKHLKK